LLALFVPDVAFTLVFFSSVADSAVVAFALPEVAFTVPFAELFAFALPVVDCAASSSPADCVVPDAVVVSFFVVLPMY
jgi:hypothetical protein